MDRLQRSDFLHHLTGQVFLSHYQAPEALAPAAAGPQKETAAIIA